MKMTKFNVKVFEVFSHDIEVEASAIIEAKEKASEVLVNLDSPNIVYQYTTSPDLWEVTELDINGNIINNDQDIFELINEFLINILDDDMGISINAYSSLCELAAKTGNLDIINKIRIQDDRCYIKGESDEV